MKKALKYLSIFIVIVLLIMILAPFVFKKQIVETVKKQANKQVEAKIDFDNDISLGFFRNFPNASLGLEDLSIVGEKEYAGDTLAYVKKLHLVIDLASLFSGDTYKIRDVSLNRPFIQLLVDSSGNANWDIAKSSSENQEDTTSSFKVGLQKYSIHQGHIIYKDASLGFLLDAEGLNHNGRGDFTQDVFDLHTQSHFAKLTVAYAGIPYLSKIETDIDADVNIDLPHSKYTLSKTMLKLNGLSLAVDGFIALPNDKDIQTDLTLKADQADFKNFLSLIPAIYQKDFDQLKASGELAFDGYVKGVYNDDRIPAFGVKLNIENGEFQYPSVPEALSEVNLDVAVKNEDGNLDHTFINMKKLHFRMGDNPFDAHLTATNIQSNPSLDGAVKGKLNLSEVSKIYPLEEGTTLSGTLDLDVSAKGNLNDIENKQYDKFDAKGQIVAQDLVYQSAGLEQKVKVPQGTLNFSPQQVSVKNVKTFIGKSDIAADGGVDNLFGYLFGKDVLKGHLNVQSQLLDLNDMMGEDTTSANTSEVSDSTSEGVKAVIIPQNLAFNIKADVGKFIYDNYELTQLKGNVRIANGILTINNLSTHMLDGSAQLTGSYNTQNPKHPKTDMSFAVNNVDIQKSFNTFNTVKALAPVASFIQGDFSGNISLNTDLNDHLYPQLTTLNSIGDIEIPNFNIKGFGPLQELASKLGIPKLKDLDISKLFMQFKVDSGYLKVQPFDFAVDDIQMQVAGRNGLNKDIDYTLQMDIPREKLGDINKGLTNLISEANKVTKGDLELGDKLPISVHLGGTITKPKVKIDFSEARKQVEEEVKSEAKNQLSKGASKLLDKLGQSSSSADSIQASNAPTDSTQKKDSKKEKDLKEELKKGLKGLLNKK